MVQSKIISAALGFGLLLGAAAGPAVGQFGQQVSRAGCVELRDRANNLRGYVQIIGNGGKAKVVFRDAEGGPIELAADGTHTGALPPLELKPLQARAKQIPSMTLNCSKIRSGYSIRTSQP